MGMSTRVIGIKPPDDQWRKMKAAYDACEAAGISPPGEVEAFFGGERPDEKGVVVELQRYEQGKKVYHPCCQPWDGEESSGFEIDITKLPPDVKVLRFYNSW